MNPSNPSQTPGPSPIAILFPGITFAVFGMLFFGGIGAAVGGNLGVAIGSIAGRRDARDLSTNL
ncbi:hypothetical protein [Halovenus sp. HT40]|uniref:hypothetical protein n=1 Tax=Halovenus sp. HT40 TaxID=3126691 RepID=UPI00300E6F4D